MHPRLSIIVLAACLAACGSSSSSGDTQPGADAGVTCPDGFTADSERIGCIDVSPADDCAAGTRATIGNAQCQPVAAMTCGAGFVPDPSGWGCRDVQPDAECSGANLETLGQTSCVPMGDCNAAFPPSGATLFVNATGSVDATHFNTVQAAIDAATSGATIAIDAGTYSEALTIGTSVNLVGKCAGMVTIQSPDGTKPGIAVTGSPTWSAAGITLANHAVGVEVSGGDATLTNIFISGAIGRGIEVNGGAAHVKSSRVFGVTDDAGGIGFGLDVSAGTLDVDASSIVKSGVAGINVSGRAKATLHATILRDTDGGAGTDGQGVGAAVSAGGNLDLESCAVTKNHVANAVVLDPGSKITVNASVLRGALTTPSKAYGDGVLVQPGGEIDLTSSTISENAEWGLTSDGPKSIVSLTNSIVRGGPAITRGGIAVELGTTLTIDDSAIAQAKSEGVTIQDKGSTGTFSKMLVRDIAATSAVKGGDDGDGVFIGVGAVVQATDVTVVNSAADAVWVGGDANHANGSQADITQLLAIGTKPGKDGRFGRGIEVGAGANATVTVSAFVGNAESAVVVDAYANATISGSVLRTSGSDSTMGFGLLVIDNATADLSQTWVRDIAGVGLAFGGAASARVDGAFVLDNQIGVYADSSTTLAEVDSQPSDLGSGDVEVSDTKFVGNATRVSADVIPLPDVNAPQ
ncbi:MAG: right-handed parallel beta-helix repeat-containing protein [Polyangiaceae bacterium]